MKIEFQETTNDLLKRIDIHSQYGARDIDSWMLEILQLQKGLRILDVGCGAGKQCFSFFQHLSGEAEITGTDVSESLLAQARQENEKRGADVRFQLLDFNKPFDLPNDYFDLISCCFAIYYAQDIPFSLGEMHRVLKPGGRLFTTGPMPTNKAIFYDIIKEATGKPIPPMPGSSRYASEIYGTMEKLFSKVEQHIFENPLTFTDVAPFMVYTRASMSEDRKLWNSLFVTHEDFEIVMEQIEKVAAARIQKDGSLVMTKVVGGFIATK
ncbi:MAG: class I SAM-dependent methyltransferase [Chloroflexi bacterium]|jgi:ubiquinone/menaquinone biosynthesis C-methylase UbiE|nr:class I SAM-dependent methyltransferase [Anaerolineaceae bacterium]NLI45458.1 class I SAM-dependent methyltransferase [Chloroflexota bacterium]HOE34532.1 class I SAM-dependent methyltransferase [Anaerolineaceae bacterium]HOT25054.1 class I SAM-dependent methyltransferase [Anaerolineaceae bacterium]HQH57706.1 class I SAM-dependent methyltransferase [Anaerolineaceae bacterium]